MNVKNVKGIMLSVSIIKENCLDGFSWNFLDWLDMIKGTIGKIVCILDFLNFFD